MNDLTDYKLNDCFLTVNLSSYTFNQDTFKLLEKGLTFVPRPPTIYLSDIIENQNNLIRNLTIKGISVQKQSTSTNLDPVSKTTPVNKKKFRFTEPKRWNPPSHIIPVEVGALTDTIKLTTAHEVDKIAKKSSNSKNKKNFKPGNNDLNFNWFINNKDKNNLTVEEMNSLRDLKLNENIIIKPADKGGATVIMDRGAYQLEAERQLNNEKYYRRIDGPMAPNNLVKIKAIFSKILKKKFITQAQYNYLTGPEDYNIRKFYLLPKIHKPKAKWPQKNMPEGRPIVSDSNSESCRTAEFLDSFINPLALSNNTAIIRNTYEFINKIRDQDVNPDSLLVTGDIKSLYTNMNLNRIMQTTRQVFANNPDPNRPDDELLNLLELTLYSNDFSFNNNQYLQIHGTAMGKKYAPGLANLYLRSFDETAQTGFQISPIFYFRFLDDVFFVWTGGKALLMKFQSFLNNLIPDIEITFEFNEVQIPFLDTLIYIKDNKLKTKTYFKPTDTHQLLHVASYHPKHTTVGILKSQFIRFKRLSSSYEDYLETCKTLFSFLKNRGYSASIFRKMKHDIWYNYNEQNAVSKLNHKTQPILPIIMPFSGIGRNLVQKYKKAIETTNLFSDFKLISAYKIYPNLKKLLVRAEFSNDHLAKTGGRGRFYRCTSTQCIFCIRYTSDTSDFKSSSTNRKYKIKGDLTCKSSNIVYLITCKKCGIQYIGETGRPLRDRVNNHISNIRKSTNTPIAQHFALSNQHKHDNLHVIAIEQISTDSHNTRKQREQHWIDTLKTGYPLGLNFL